MAKAKPKYICKYCGTKTFNSGEICSNCRAKQKLMQGWHWVYVGKGIKEDKKNEEK